MRSLPDPRRKTIIAAVLLLTGIAAAIIIYYFFDPAGESWMPACLLKKLTGFDCPACGFQRALHALLHGEILAAVRFNLFFLIAVPWLISVIYGYFPGLPAATRIRRIAHGQAAGTAYIVLFFIWWVLRNIIGM